MKIRHLLAVPLLAAALSVGTLVPAEASAFDAVTNLTVSVEQAPGSHDAWKVTASWTANPDADAYSVVIADQANGQVTPGASYGNQDTSGSSVTITTTKLVADQDYWISVRPIRPVYGFSQQAVFHTPTLDTTAPSGSYSLDRRKAFLPTGYDSDAPSAATFLLTQRSIDPGPVTRTVLLGNATAAKAWTSSKPFPLQYSSPGTFTPQVRLTDQFGNTRVVTLPSVQVLVDRTKPSLTILRPAAPRKVASWRIVRGTAADAGTGLDQVGAFVVQQRAGLWWAYDFKKRTWVKGYKSLGKTLDKSRARPAFMQAGPNGYWKTPVIRGLTTGMLHVEAIAIDREFNYRLAKLDQRLG